MEHGVQDIFVEEFDGISGAGRPGDVICMFLVALDHPVDVVLEHANDGFRSIFFHNIFTK